MDERASHCARIPRLPDAGPVWSVMIPTFNCARYLGHTLQSVLRQDPGPDLMQIEVVDDASTLDDPQEIVAAVAPGRVALFRQKTTVGHIRNFETCLRRARGQLVHLLHGDDYVRQGYYAKMETAFRAHPAPGAAFCRHIYMDERGHWQGISPLEQEQSGLVQDALARLAVEQRIVTPSIVVRRDVYEQLGAFDERLLCSEDWEMWVRIAAHYPIWYEPEPLAVYRMHTDSNTGRHIRTGEDMRFTRLAIDLLRCHLPPEKAGAWTNEARQTYARSALATGYSLFRSGDVRGALTLAREAFRLSPTPAVIFRAVRLGFRAVLG